MSNSRNTKRSFITSILAMVTCLTMLIGTTFAWFTDTASTAVNKIQSGTLKVDIVKVDENGNAGDSIAGESLSFKDVKGNDDILWEPGARFALDSFEIVNKGNLALQYKVLINGVKGSSKLLEAIDFTVSKDGEEEVKLEDWSGILLPVGKTGTGKEESGASKPITIYGTMKTTAKNEYQNLSIEGLGITVIATQYTYENDSNDNQYDLNATEAYEEMENMIYTNISVPVANGETVINDNDAAPQVTVTVPKAAVADGETKLHLVIMPRAQKSDGISIESTETFQAYDIKVEGIKANNQEDITVKMFVGYDLIGVKVYHNSEIVDNASYDATTGFVTFTTKSFSPYTVVYSSVEMLKDRFAAGGNITVKNDIKIESVTDDAASRIIINKPATLTLNGKIYTPDNMGNNGKNFTALIVAADTTINANENGGIDTGNNGGYAINVMNGANLTITGGYYYGGGTAVQVQKGTVTITGGTFVVEPYSDPVYGNKFMLNCIDSAYKDGTAQIIVKGGTYKNFDPSNSDSENPKANFVPEGYKVVTDVQGEDTWYTVVPE